MSVHCAGFAVLSAMNQNSQTQSQNLANAAPPPPAPAPNGGGMQVGRSLIETLNEQSMQRSAKRPGMDLDELMKRFSHTV